jgi:hypothetical protein
MFVTGHASQFLAVFESLRRGPDRARDDDEYTDGFDGVTGVRNHVFESARAGERGSILVPPL